MINCTLSSNVKVRAPPGRSPPLPARPAQPCQLRIIAFDRIDDTKCRTLTAGGRRGSPLTGNVYPGTEDFAIQRGTTQS
ncbi:unnamed protein product [Colias eurytheme]|nr:unnamed protein product [Colias eurytheme]